MFERKPLQGIEGTAAAQWVFIAALNSPSLDRQSSQGGIQSLLLLGHFNIWHILFLTCFTKIDICHLLASPLL